MLYKSNIYQNSRANYNQRLHSQIFRKIAFASLGMVVLFLGSSRATDVPEYEYNPGQDSRQVRATSGKGLKITRVTGVPEGNLHEYNLGQDSRQVSTTSYRVLKSSEEYSDKHKSKIMGIMKTVGRAVGRTTDTAASTVEGALVIGGGAAAVTGCGLVGLGAVFFFHPEPLFTKAAAISCLTVGAAAIAAGGAIAGIGASGAAVGAAVRHHHRSKTKTTIIKIEG